MSGQINTVAISARLTKDPELRHTQSEKAVTELRVANNRRVKQGEEWVDVPNYFSVIAWESLATIAAQKCKTGDLIYVVGRLQWREWESDAGKREKVEIIADRIEGEAFFRTAETTGAAAEPGSSQGASDDDIPF